MSRPGGHAAPPTPIETIVSPPRDPRRAIRGRQASGNGYGGGWSVAALSSQARSSSGPEGDRECKRGTDAHVALDPDLAAVELDELAGESQPEPGAFHLLGGRPHLAKLLEDGLLIFRGDPDPAVSDRDLDHVLLPRRPDVDPP